MDEQGRPVYEFGPFHLDTSQRLLLRAGELVPLAPKTIDTLLVLVAHRGQVVEKEELIRLVWPDTVVEEGGLAKNISLLRKALGDDAEDSRYIETIPKRGYRFVAEVRVVARQEGVKRRRWVGVVAAAGVAALSLYAWDLSRRRQADSITSVRSIVVLPLQALPGTESADAFAVGMTEALRTALGTIAELHVVDYSASQSKEPPEEIARKRKVDAALVGSVARDKNRVRVIARLIQSGTGRQLWSRALEGELRDYLKLQDDVAQAIAGQIQIQVTPQRQALLPRSRPVHPEAVAAYFQGRRLWNRRTGEGIGSGMKYFEEAIAKDSGYALPYAGLADAYALLGSMPYDQLRPRQAGHLARQMADKALERDRDLVDAHTSLGYVKLSFDWDWREAEKQFRRAIEIDPSYATAHHWYAHALIAAGRFQEAREQIQKAQELSPLSLIIGVGAGWCAYQAGQADHAIAEYRKVLEADPTFGPAHFALGLALAQKGNPGKAIEAFQKAIELSQGQHLTAVAGIGWVHAKAGERDEADRYLRMLAAAEAKGRYVQSLYRAVIQEALGNKAEAMRWATRAFEERSEYLVYVRVEPLLAGLRAQPRFQELMRKHGLEK